MPNSFVQLSKISFSESHQYFSLVCNGSEDTTVRKVTSKYLANFDYMAGAAATQALSTKQAAREEPA